MTRFRTSFAARLVATGLTLALYVLPGLGSAAALAAAKGKPTARPTLTLAVLPFDKQAQGGSETLGADLAAAVKSALEATGKFYVVAYSERLPSVQRAVQEGSISKRDTEGPFSSDKALAARVGRAMGADAALTGSVEQIKVDVPNGVAEVTANVQLVSTETGEILKAIVLTGKNATKPEGAGEEELVSLAARDVANKIAAEIVTESTEGKLALLAAKPLAVAPEKKHKKSKTMKFLLLAILLGAGIALAGGGGDGGGGGNGGEPPPPPPPPPP